MLDEPTPSCRAPTMPWTTARAQQQHKEQEMHLAGSQPHQQIKTQQIKTEHNMDLHGCAGTESFTSQEQIHTQAPCM